MNLERAKRLTKISFRFWLTGIVFSLAHGMLKVRSIFIFKSEGTVLAQAARLTKEAKVLKVWGDKDLTKGAAREKRLSVVETSVGPMLYSFKSILMTSCTSARENNRRQLVIDLLDVWIPATGAELLNVNEGTLGILGYVLGENIKFSN